MRRVVVTGLGIVSPLGIGISKVWHNLINGKSGISKITQFDVSDLACQIAGFAVDTDDEDKKINLDKYINPKEQKKMGRFIQMACIAAAEAVNDAGITSLTEEESWRAGVMMGSGIGGLQGIEETTQTLLEKGVRRVSPFFVPANLINLTSGFISIFHGLRGPNSAVATACASGTHAIGDSARMIQYGSADIMVCGGAESPISRLGIAGFIATRALATSFNDNPTEASRPYDSRREGFVMGEGSGVLVLEEYEHAKKRGAKIYAEVIGYGMSGDGYHLTAPPEDGNGGFRAMQTAVQDAKISTDKIGYINAHGTSTPLGDEIELRAIHRLFGDNNCANLAVSSTKSATGHLLGAAGAIEAIFSIMALQEQILPPTLNLHDPCPHFGLNLVPLIAQEKKIDKVLSNSFGFGGTNASIIFQKS